MGETTKSVTYESTNTYDTMNELTDQTKNIWVVFHGIGYLSRYFLKYFNELPPEENYIIAPQAPSKYYLKNEYKYVGASWLTKENTLQETKNVMSYLDRIMVAEQISGNENLIVFGFSQGVSIATRWVTSRKLNCSELILYAGGIPNELESADFDHITENNSNVRIIVGDSDAYLTPERMKTESKRIATLFRGKAALSVFKGGHEIKKEIINALV